MLSGVSMVFRSEVEVALEAVSGTEVVFDGFLLLVPLKPNIV